MRDLVPSKIRTDTSIAIDEDIILETIQIFAPSAEDSAISLWRKKNPWIDNVISSLHDKVQIRLVSCTKKWVVNIHKTPEYTIALSGHYLAKHLGYSIHSFPEHDPWQTLNAEGGPISRYLVTRNALISIDLIKNLNIYIESAWRYRLINC